jgi:hypothetical protein
MVTGYPGTTATENVEDRRGYPSVLVEWSHNEKVVEVNPHRKER